MGRAVFSISIMNIGAQYVWLVLFGGAKKWEKGKSTKDQGLSSDTTTIELGMLVQSFNNNWRHFCRLEARQTRMEFCFCRVCRLPAKT